MSPTRPLPTGQTLVEALLHGGVKLRGYVTLDGATPQAYVDAYLDGVTVGYMKVAVEYSPKEAEERRRVVLEKSVVFPDGEIVCPETPFDLGRSLVLMGRRGSEAHGTYVPPSEPVAIDDRDVMGICLPPAPWALGIRQWDGAEAIAGVWDVVLYDFRKFVRLLVKQNPNVLAMLWLEPEDYLMVRPAGHRLIEHRDLFRCRSLAYEAFVGYARAQLKQMRAGAFRGYMGERRKKLVARLGYDAKNAGHCVRLLHMGEEFLTTGRLQVRRTWDRDMLIDIKGGKWSLEDVQAYAEKRLAAMAGALENSVLPEAIDADTVEALVLKSMREAMEGEWS